jgi:hypothetical protein
MPHIGLGKIKILADGRQERRNDPAQPTIDGVGRHEGHENDPAVSALRGQQVLGPEGDQIRLLCLFFLSNELAYVERDPQQQAYIGKLEE